MNLTEDENERIAIMVYDGQVSEAEAIKCVTEHGQWKEWVTRIRDKATEQKMKKNFRKSRKEISAGEID